MVQMRCKILTPVCWQVCVPARLSSRKRAEMIQAGMHHRHCVCVKDGSKG